MALIASGPYHYHTSAGKKARHRSTRMVTFPQTTMRIESLFTLRPPATPWVTTECPDAGLPVCGPRKAVAQLHHKANDAMGDRQMPKRLNVRPCAEKGRRAASSQGQHSPNPHKSMPEWPPFSPGCFSSKGVSAAVLQHGRDSGMQHSRSNAVAEEDSFRLDTQSVAMESQEPRHVGHQGEEHASRLRGRRWVAWSQIPCTCLMTPF
mmetsp:Transcript_42857/g.128647  ORF Transcript_42857/g.128647 Transcript_42857/m.128647 type:complete len:207 (-) Transcript_42857:74-694(-)